MADNSIHQAFIEDPPNVLKEKPSEGAKWPPRLCLPGYLLVGVIIFYCFMDQISGKRTNRVLDALYFVIVTMTAVGYGDFVPKSDTTKLLACAFVSADYLVEKQEVLFFKAMHMNMKGGEAKMLRAMETYRIKYKFYTVTLLLVMIIVTGNLFLWKVEKLSLVDSFYCVCATMTTLGYVDKCFSSKLGPIFAIFWVIMSTILLAQFFQYVAELAENARQMGAHQEDNNHGP
uniref:Potassium channel domain-containing protein n=1 Tax=Setaria italica TaxID=4555 RepID=K4AEM9_SETIT